MPPKRKSTGEDNPSQPKKAKAAAKPAAKATAKATPAAPKSIKVGVRKDLSLDIPFHEKIFKAIYRELKQSVKADWHNGYEEHIEIQDKLVGKFVDWQQEIFHAAILPGYYSWMQLKLCLSLSFGYRGKEAMNSM